MIAFGYETPTISTPEVITQLLGLTTGQNNPDSSILYLYSLCTAFSLDQGAVSLCLRFEVVALPVAMG
jgi:hypothetical protein